MNTFYEAKHLSLAKKREILQYVKERATKWWVDKLDCSISWSRVRVHDISYDKAIKMLKKDDYFTIIHRKISNEIEIGYRHANKDDVDYFLWVYIPVSELDKLITKFNLKKKQHV